MKRDFYEAQLSYVAAQRRLFVGMIVWLLVIVLLQSGLLFFKREKTIIVPPLLKQSYWVEGMRFSPSYVEEMALFFCHLLLDVTESSVLPQGEILLRYIEPSVYGEFKQKLLEDEKRLKKQQLSLHFYPQTVTHLTPASVEIQGLLHTYVGAQKIAQYQETYQLTFKPHQGQLFLEAFQLVKTDKGNRDE